MTWIVLLVLFPALAWLAGQIASATDTNFWIWFVPGILILGILYQFGGRFFRKR